MRPAYEPTNQLQHSTGSSTLEREWVAHTIEDIEYTSATTPTWENCERP